MPRTCVTCGRVIDPHVVCCGECGIPMGCDCGQVPVGEWPDSQARAECPMHGARITQADHEKAAEIVSREYDTPSHLAYAIAAPCGQPEGSEHLDGCPVAAYLEALK